MYERFTDHSRKVMQLANQEALRFNHEYIGTEHILLGLVKEGSGVAANVLKNLDIDLSKIRLEVEKIVQPGPDMVKMGKLPHTPQAKKVIEYSIEEFRILGHDYVGTEHLLLGLLRVREGVAARVLMNLGLELEDIREEILNLLGHNPMATEEGSGTGSQPSVESATSMGPARLAGDEDRVRELVSTFDDRARKVMQLANQEAQRFNHEYIDTEHILLGLVKEGSGVAANVLKNLDIDLRKIRLEVEKIVQSGPDMVKMGKLPQTPQAKKVIEYSIEEARNLGHDHVGTEHLLLGLLWEQEGVAAGVLMNLGLKLEDVREESLNLLPHNGAPVLTKPYSPLKQEARSRAEAGHIHDLAALPDDVDYIQHLAAELGELANKRRSLRKTSAAETMEELRRAGKSRGELNSYFRACSREHLDRMLSALKDLALPEESIDWYVVAKLFGQIAQDWAKTEAAVAETDFELAAACRDQVDKAEKVRNVLLMPLLTRLSSQPPSSPPPEPVALSPFSRAHLALFRAEEFLNNDSLGEAAQRFSGVESALQAVLGERLNTLLDQLLERLEFLQSAVDESGRQACLAELGSLRSQEGADLKDRAASVQRLRERILGLISERPKLVCKVNVFEHGGRDVIEIKDGDTIASLQASLKEKYGDRIEQYLHCIHNRRVSPSEIVLRFYADGDPSALSESELEPQTLLATISKRDTEGVTWYPELAGADPALYRWTSK